MYYVWNNPEMHIEFKCEDLKERDLRGSGDADGRLILYRVFLNYTDKLWDQIDNLH